MLVAVLDRRHSAERIVGSFFVVIGHPPVGGFADVVETGEKVSVGNFLAEGAIEAFDERVLIRFSWLDVLQCDAVGLEPTGEHRRMLAKRSTHRAMVQG